MPDAISLKEKIDYLNKELNMNYINWNSEFIEEYEVEEPTDFNGWQCEWRSTMNYEGKTIHIYGEAFYGRITLQLDE